MRRFLSLLLVSMGLATAPGCAPSPGPTTRIPPLSSGPQAAAGLPVCEVAGETLRGDLVRPDRTTHKRRALLFVHGGGWRGGAREDFAPLMHALAGQGYTGLTVDYRLSPAVRHPEHLADVKCPRSIDFREELPRHPTGKLYKRLLKDEYWAAAGRKI